MVIKFSKKGILEHLALVNRFLLPLFLVSFFLIKIPPFYLFPPVTSSLFTSHSLARGLILFLFLALVLKVTLEKKEFVKRKQRVLILVFLTYLILQSLSVFGAQNMTAFLQRYKDIVFPGIFLFCLLYLLKYKEKIVWIFLSSAVVNFFYEMFMLIFPQAFKSWAPEFIYSAHLQLVFINLERARIFIETYDEITIPFLFIFFFKYKKNWQRALLLVIFLMIALPSFLSNFRSRVLILLISFAASLIFLTARKIFSKLSFLGLLAIFAMFSVWLSNVYFGFSIADRFTFKDPKEDVQTIETRVQNIGVSFDMAKSSPMFGVGLGNYYDNLSSEKKTNISLFSWVQKEAQIASANPHDIFLQTVSETGFVSLIFLVCFLVYFFVEDTKIMFGKKEQFTKASIIAFWSLFSYAVFNPTTTLTYNSLFWVLRVIIL